MDITDLLIQPVTQGSQFHGQGEQHAASIQIRPRRQSKWKCSACNRFFPSRYYLKQHTNTVHFGVRPHECKICQKRFGQKGTLSRHVADVHHRRNRKACLHFGCSQEFASEVSRMVHEIRAHHSLRADRSTYLEAVGHRDKCSCVGCGYAVFQTFLEDF